MKCPTCGRLMPGPRGRPKKLDDKKIREMRRKDKSLAEIAEKFGVTRGAVQYALRRLSLKAVQQEEK